MVKDPVQHSIHSCLSHTTITTTLTSRHHAKDTFRGDNGKKVGFGSAIDGGEDHVTLSSSSLFLYRYYSLVLP